MDYRIDIIKRVKMYQDMLHLNDWEIHVSFKKFPAGENKEWEPDADITTNCKYLSAKINFNPELLDKISDRTIIHELVHCLLSEYETCSNNNAKEGTETEQNYHLERTVCQLTSIFLNLFKLSKQSEDKGITTFANPQFGPGRYSF